MNREKLLQHAEKCERLADLSQMEPVQQASLRVAAEVCRRLAVTSAPGNDAGSCDKPTGVDTNTDDPQNSKENPAGKGGA
jgi:hypothetical protein